MVKTAPKNLEDGDILKQEDQPQEAENKTPAADSKVTDAKTAIMDLMVKNFAGFSHSNPKQRLVTNKTELLNNYIQYLRSSGKGDLMEQLCAQMGVKELSLETLEGITLESDKGIDTLFQSRMKDQQETRKFYGLACTYVQQYEKTLKKNKATPSLMKSFSVIVEKVTNGDYDSFQEVLQLCSDWVQKNAKKLDDTQRKALKKVFIGGAREVKSTLADLDLLSSDEKDYIDETGLIQQGSIFQRTMADMLNLYATSELSSQLDTYDKNTEKLVKSFANPSLQSRIERFPNDDETLCAVTPELKKILASDASDEVKLQARKDALIKLIATDDPHFASLLQDVSNTHGNIARISSAHQQQYIDLLKDEWKDAPQLKPFKELLQSKEIGMDAETYNKVVDQLFDLSSDKLEIKNKNGEIMTLHLKKHIANHSWSSDSLSESFAGPFPIIYEMDGTQRIDPQTGKLDAKTYALLGQTDKKSSFVLEDTDGKEQTVQPGNKADIINKTTQVSSLGVYISKNADEHIIAYASAADLARNQNGTDLGTGDQLQIINLTPSLVVDGAKDNAMSSFMTLIAANKKVSESDASEILENEQAYAADKVEKKLDTFKEHTADKKQLNKKINNIYSTRGQIDKLTPEEKISFERKTPYLTPDAIFAHGNLSDTERTSAAWKLLIANTPDGETLQELTPSQEQAIIDAHNSTRHASEAEGTISDGQYYREIGSDKMNIAGYFNYTDTQLKKKIDILKKGGFESWQIKLLLEDGLCGTSPNEQLSDLANKLAEQKAIIAEIEKKIREQRKTVVNTEGKTLIDITKEGEFVNTEIVGLDKSLVDARKELIAKDITPEHKEAVNKQIEAWTELKKELIAKKQQLLEAANEFKEAQSSLEKDKKDAEKTKNDLQKLFNDKQKEVDVMRNISVGDFDALSPEEQKERVDSLTKEYNKDREALVQEKKQVDDLIVMNKDFTEDEKQVVRKRQTEITNQIKDVDAKITQLKDRLKEAQKKRADSSEKKERNENNESYKMLEMWKAIQGDSFSHDKVTFGLKPGSELYVNDGADSPLLGGGTQRIKFIVDSSSNIDEGRIVLKAYGVSGDLVNTNKENIEGTEVVIEGSDGLSEFMNLWHDAIKLRAPEYSMKSRGERIKSDQLSFKNTKKLDDRYKQLIKTVDFGSMTKQAENGEGKKEDIKYFGASFYDLDDKSEKYVEKKAWYKVSFSGNIVKLSIPDENGGTKWSKKLTMNEFLLFAADKNLKPYSQNDVDTINARNEGSEASAGQDVIHDGVIPAFQSDDRMLKINKRGAFGLRWRSLGAFKKSWKTIQEAFTKKMKEKEKENEDALWGDLLATGLFEKLEKAGIPVLSEAFEDLRAGMDAKRDQEKMKKIEKFAGEPEENKDTTPGGTTAYIEGVLFGDGKENEKKALKDITGTAEAYKNPLKAAGYYQYVLSKDGPYYRNLAKYKGSGLWVRFILGEGMQQQYLKWRAKVEVAYRNNPNDPTIKNQYVFDEAWFMSKIVQNKEYASPLDENLAKEIEKQIQHVLPKGWMGGLVDNAEKGYLNSSKLEEAAKTKEYANFQSLYTYDFRGAIEKKGAHVGIGMLQGMADKVKKDETAWKQWSLGMLYPILSGQLDDSVVEGGVKGFYLGLARKYSFPLGLYSVSGDKHGREELVDLLSIFEKYSGNKPEKSIRSIVAKVDPRDYESFSKALRPWWDTMKDDVLDYTTNPSKLFTLEKTIRDNVDGQRGSEQEKLNKLAVVKDFIDKKVQDTEETGDFSSAKGDSIILKKNLWSISKSASRSHLWNMTPDYSKFKEKTVEYAPGLWQELRKKLETFNNEKLTGREIAHLLNRFYAINQVSGIIGTESKKYLLQAIALGNTGSVTVAGTGKNANNANAANAANTVDINQKKLIRRAIIGSIDAKTRNGENIHPDVKVVLELRQKIFLKPEVREKLGEVINDIPDLKEFRDKFDIWTKDSQKLKDRIQEEESKKGVKELKKQFDEGGGGYTDDDDDDDDY